jgi:hypothetical protein
MTHTTISLFEVLTLAGALIGVYFKLQTEVGIISVDEIKILLAQKGIK